MDNQFNNNDNQHYSWSNAYSQPEEQPLTRKGMKAMKKVQKADAKAAKKAAKAGKKKPFWKKAVAYTLSAIMLGAVAGGACYGVSYAGYNIFPIKSGSNSNKGNSSPVYEASQLGNVTINKDISTTVLDVSDMVDYVITSVVAIDGTYTTSYGYFGNRTSQVSGSGIIIGVTDTEMLIVTNDHVVDGVDNLKVSFSDGSEADATVRGAKSSYDLAVLSIKRDDIPSDAVYSVATLGDSSSVKVGEAAIAVGNSMGYGISVTTGCISALNKTVTVDNVEYKDLIQTDAAINPGNSGGALFNAEGEVIGINSVKMSTTGVEGMGYAISISSVKEIIDELSIMEVREALSDDKRGYLGITGVTITDEISQTYGYPTGVAIRSISENGAADKAGLKKNDIIVSVDGESVSTIEELVSLMSYYAIGEKVEVEYYHMNSDGEYEKQTATLELTARTE